MRLYVLLAGTLMMLAATVAAVAQDGTGQVNGRVVSSRGNEPLGLVQVDIQGTTLRVVTAEDGTFHIPIVPAGNYVLQASAVGFYSNRVEFVLAAGDNKNIEIVLTSSTTKRTDSVEVVADVFGADVEPSAAGFSLESAERKNLASVLSDDPLKAVQSLPGVTSNNDFSSEFSVRGAPFSRVGLYLDGILIHSPFHTTDGQADNGSLTIFNGDLTEDMSLFQGAWPVRYSDRTAGILAVDTREGNRQGVQGEATASASNAGILLEGPVGRNQRGAWLANFRKSYLQYILNRIDFGDQPPLSFGFLDGQARLDYDLTPRHALSVNYLGGSSAVDRTRYRSELGPSTVMTSGFHFTLVNVGSRYVPSQRLLVNNHFAWSHEKGEADNRDGAALVDQNYSELTWRGDVSFIWSPKSTLDFGGVFRRPRQDGLTKQFIYAPTVTPASDTFHGAADQAGAYVQESLAMDSGRLRLAAGVREDEHSRTPVKITSPYASVSFDPWSKTHLQFDWGQYGQYPELSQFFSTFALTHLLPQRATHYEAAVEQRLDERTRIRLEFYDRQDRDLIARPSLDPYLLADGRISDAVPDAPLLNSQRGYARGVEVFLQRRSANGLNGWISYAYGRAIIHDGVLQVKFASDYDQRHTLNAYASRRLRPTINVSGRFTYGSGMPLPGFYRLVNGDYQLAANRNGLRAPAYERTDLRVNKAYIHQRVKTTLFGEIVNVTNHTNRDFDSPGPYDNVTGRTFPNFYSMFPILPSIGMLFEF